MAFLNLVITGGEYPVNISVKQTGDSLERFTSYSNGVVEFTPITIGGNINYTITVTKEECSSASTTFNLNCTEVLPEVPEDIYWVEFPLGLILYNSNSNIITNVFQITLSGVNHNILSLFTQLPLTDKNNEEEVDYRMLSYSIDYGNYQDVNNIVGWTVGIPTNIEVIPDGRVHTITIGYVNDIWGSNPRTNRVTNVYQMLFKVGGISNKENAINYPNTFVCNNNMLPNFLDEQQFPNFTLTNKFNSFSGVKPTIKCGTDLRNKGFSVFQLIKEDVTSFSNTVNYRTEYDNWAKDYGWTSTIGLNNSNQSVIENLATIFMNSLTAPNKGLMVRDDEWRNGENHTENGKLMEYYFFKKCNEISSSTVLGCHHGSPYSVDVNNTSIENMSKPLLNNTYTTDNLIVDYVNSNFFGVYWADIQGRTRGDNAGQYINFISVSAYQSHYNQCLSSYLVAHSLMVNKKYFPSKKVCATIEEIIEVNLNNQEPVVASWQYNESFGELERLSPLPTCAYDATITAISLFVADGINVWNEGAIRQETDRGSFYALSSDYLPNGWVGTTENGEYAKRFLKFNDYVVAEMYKYSTLPLELQSPLDVILPDISVDNSTWISGDYKTPAVLGIHKNPMAFVITNNSKTTILASFPYNAPNQLYTFRVRYNNIIKTVSVNGQYPELFYFEN